MCVYCRKDPTCKNRKDLQQRPLNWHNVRKYCSENIVVKIM